MIWLRSNGWYVDRQGPPDSLHCTVHAAHGHTMSTFIDDLGADSLDTVELVMALEEEFETEIPDEEAEKITTVQQAIDYVNGAKKG